jgi:hypothetical protein
MYKIARHHGMWHVYNCVTGERVASFKYLRRLWEFVNTVGGVK